MKRFGFKVTLGAFRIRGRRPYLAADWRPGALSLLLFDRTGNLRYERIALDQPAAAEAIKKFIPASGVSKAILSIPRSEVLQKEIDLGGEDAGRDALQKQVCRLLPCPPAEMSYAVAVDTPKEGGVSRGLLYAIPETRLKDTLAFFSQAGIELDEIVSEDQALCWLLHDKAADTPVLLLDRMPGRTLALAVRGQAIVMSQSFEAGERPDNMLREIALLLLKSGHKPRRIYRSGNLTTEEIHEIRQAFDLEPEALPDETAGDRPIPALFSGLKKWNARPAVSLLPNRLKLRRNERVKNRLWSECLMALGLWIAVWTFLASCHLFLLNQRTSELKEESVRIAAAVSELRDKAATLDAVTAAAMSRNKFLSLIRELGVPARQSIHLKEFRWERGRIMLRGEAPSDALLADALQSWGKIEGVSEAKLERVQSRRRMGREFFDFEATGRWTA